MKRVLLKYYNNSNLGDDLFVKIITQRYTNTFTSIGRHERERLSNDHNLLIKYGQIIYIMSKVIERILRRPNLLLTHLSKRNDLLLYVGGSIFIEHGNIKSWEKELHFYNSLTIPYYILGSNYGPSSSKKFKGIINAILKNASDVCFRDKASYDLFKNNSSSRLATDLVFTHNPQRIHNSNKRKVALFSIIDGRKRFSKDTTIEYEKTIRELTIKYIKNGYEVIYMSFCKYEGDEDAILRVLTGLPQNEKKQIKTFNYGNNINEALDLISGCNTIIASRFHATILGLVYKKKTLPIVYSSKTKNILDDMKFNGPVIDINNLDAFDVESFDPAKLKVFNVDKQIKLAEKQFQELDKVLVRRDLHE